MNYLDIMDILSQCGLGSMVLDENNTILSVSSEGDRLLHGEGQLEGKPLPAQMESLCGSDPAPVYVNIAFGEYLLRCPSPSLPDLPPGARLVVFRAAANDACHDMLISVVNQIKESVILCDAESRIYLLNDAAVKMDTIETRNVLGAPIDDIYRTRDGSELLVPRAIGNRKQQLDIRQYYTTCFGKDVDIVANCFPIVQNGQVLGGFSVMEDWSTIDNLHKQIIDLREKLLELMQPNKKRTKNDLKAKYRFKDIICISSAMRNAMNRCRQVAKSSSSVMIYGETGTGKELFAQSIHNASSRANGPFLAINCAAIPENLLEGLLFGTERGAYTGAERRAGLFEQADGGTLLLDEINSMNISLQSKLLRVLQDGMIRRVGGSAETYVDVRVLSNINIPPRQAVEKNKLRQDLFYRLGVIQINVPPLRERKEDIPLLCKHFIMRYNKTLMKNVRNVDKDVLGKFQNYSWPGNVRELQHAIEYAINLIPDDWSMITSDYIPEHIAAQTGPADTFYKPPNLRKDSGEMPGSPPIIPKTTPFSDAMKNIECETICLALRQNNGNISAAARQLGLSRQNLQHRIKRHNIDLKDLLEQPTEYADTHPARGSE